ncbi:MAG: ABC-F family ATP-binding cassette domain-containing protein [Arcticibacter sp.]
MNILTGEGLGKAFSEKSLFEGISISLQKNQKSALIAANGVGKSTLLRILAGKEAADTGIVSIRNSVTMGYLEQEPALDPNAGIMDVIFESSSPVLKALGRYEFLIDLGELADKNELQETIDLIDSLGAWDHESKAREILSKLGIHDLEKTIGTLSGGQKKRVALARLLVEEPDLLLLDEPTNHLDLDMIEWLESYLSKLSKTILLISHDRYFLEGVCDTILELTPDRLYSYQGDYAYFLEKKEDREFREGREIDKANNLLRTELEWMRRQPRARGTKQKARIDSFYDLEKKAGSAKNEDKMQITMQMSRMGSKILELENVCKELGGRKLIQDLSHVFKRGEKIGIVGKNGSGKSTLLNMIMGLVKPDAGKIRAGETMKFGYFSQEGLKLPANKRVIEVARDIAEYIETGNGNYMNVTKFLEHFKFSPSTQHNFVSKLSGGEKRRLQLLTVLLQSPNFLILDEPTNDLDIVTLNLLEEFLMGYEGCLLLVTHDRYFMDKLVDHVFVLTDGGKILDIHGNYSSYRDAINNLEKKSAKPEEVTAVSDTRNRNRKEKLSYKEQQEYQTLETEITNLETEKFQLENKLSDATSSAEDIHKISSRYGEVCKLIDDKTIRWLELADKAG